MQRASLLLRGLSLPAGSITSQELACTAWATAVGKKVAAHTRAAKLVRTRLVVEVEDKTWQRQLWALSGQILRNLEKHLGPGAVDDLEFRVLPRRREPERAIEAAPAAAPDESAAIEDPVLRGIYRAARRRALA